MTTQEHQEAQAEQIARATGGRMPPGFNETVIDGTGPGHGPFRRVAIGSDGVMLCEPITCLSGVYMPIRRDALTSDAIRWLRSERSLRRRLVRWFRHWRATL